MQRLQQACSAEGWKEPGETPEPEGSSRQVPRGKRSYTQGGAIRLMQSDCHL
ncbi:Hypothetical predicted protein, partial [Marmota monax]